MADNTATKCVVGDIAAPSRNSLVGGPFGSDLVSRDYMPSGVPVIRGTNMGHGRWVDGEFVYVSGTKADSLCANCAKPGDLVFTQRGTLGQVAIIPKTGSERYVISQSQMKLTVDPEKASVLFLYYVFSSVEQQEFIKQNAIQTGVPHTNLGILRNTPLTLPPLHEQRIIADILGSLDDKIELNHRMNETLEAMARAIFKSWFVDFDPVYAKSKGCQPEGMDDETAKLFPSGFQDSEMGKMPKGWKLNTVSEVADINSWTLGKNDDLDSIQYIEISEVNRGDIGHIQGYKRGQEPSRARRRLRHGDTVLSTVRPDRGSYFLCLQPSPDLIASTGFAVFSPTKVPWSILHAGLTQPEVFEHLGQHADGGAYPAVRPEIIGQWRLVLPDDDAILNAFHSLCAGLFEKAEDNRCQAKLLSLLRDVLLPELLSGEVAVPTKRIA